VKLEERNEEVSAVSVIDATIDENDLSALDDDGDEIADRR